MSNIARLYTIFISISLALMLMIVHIPFSWQWYRPQWLTLILIYWVFARPQWVGIGVAWFSGFALDVLTGSMLCQHALAMSIVVYIAQQLRPRLRLFTILQQLFVVTFLVGTGQLILLAVQWLSGDMIQSPWYIISTLSSVFVWPFGYRFMNRLDRSPAIKYS